MLVYLYRKVAISHIDVLPVRDTEQSGTLLNPLLVSMSGLEGGRQNQENVHGSDVA